MSSRSNDRKMIQDVSEAGYIQIRKYVIDLVIQSAGKAQRLDSMRNLAGKFGVGPTTVHKALEKLVNDGYLTAKIGVGMFTNPQMAWQKSRTEVIDLLFADGRQIYYENYICQMAAAICTRITADGKLLHPVELFQVQPVKEPQNGLSPRGLIWLAPDMVTAPHAEEYVLGQRIPVVIMAGKRHGISWVDYDYEEEGYDIATRLLAEKRTNPIILANASNFSEQVNGFLRAFREHGLEFNPAMLFERNANLTQNVCHALKTGPVPDAIYDLSGSIDQLQDILTDQQIDIHENCRLVLNTEWTCGLPGWIIGRDPQLLAEQTWIQFKKLLDNPQTSITQQKIKRPLNISIE